MSEPLNLILHNSKITIKGTGEMAQQLRALAALPKDPGFNFQHPHDSSQQWVTPAPGDLMLSYDLLWLLHAYSVQIHTYI